MQSLHSTLAPAGVPNAVAGAELATPLRASDAMVGENADLNIIGAEKDASATQPAPALRQLRVVVVEDSSSDVELVKHVLKKGGFDAECEVAQTAEEFESLVHKNGFDMVLADYSLPLWNGMETVEILRREGLDIPRTQGC
jgi:PleD family two-component response regulator